MTDPNPYAPPSIQHHRERETATERFSASGAFNDRGTLVLGRKNCQLPNVCLKSGEPTDDRYRLSVRTLPMSKKAGIAVMGGAVGLMIANSIWGKQFDLDLPLRSDWVDPTNAKSKRGWKVVWLGFALIVIGIVLSVFSEAMIALCGIGMVVGIVGLFLGGYKSSRGPFSISNFNEDFVWIKGADQSIVNLLEPLPKP